MTTKNIDRLGRFVFGVSLLSPFAAAQLDWKSLSGSGAPGWGSASAWDAARSRLVAFGGVQSGLPTNITSQWNGTAWVVGPPMPTPSARSFGAMAFDAARGNCVMFGGALNPVTSTNETWTWNGNAWSLRSPAAAPSPRMHLAIAYDSVRQVVVVFGGWLTPAFVATDETWEWNGVTWAQRTSLGATPPPRKNASMAFDAARGLTVMCGGYDALTDSSMNDTWTWDGATWTQRANLPIAVSDHALVHDNARQHVVLFGGQNIVTGSVVANLDQVLDWDGMWWTPRPTITTPGPRVQCARGWDPVNHRVVFAGGLTPGTVFSDTLALAPIAAAEFASFGSGCPSSSGPLSLGSSSLPYIGGHFVQELTNAPAAATHAVVVFGFSNTLRSGSPLPLAMSPFGAPGCELLVSDEGFLDVPLLNGGGTHSWAVPDLATLVGQPFFAQAFVLDPLLASALPIATTAGRAARIGSP